MLIYGVVLPEGKQNPQDIADEFTPEEVKLIRLSGLPIMVDHKDGTSVGNISHDFLGQDGKKYIVGKIDESQDLRGKLTASRIKHGALRDFSLTHRFDLDQHIPTGQFFQTKTPIEVSVCREGRRTKCHILAFAEDNQPVGNANNLYSGGINGPDTNQNLHITDTVVMASNGSVPPTQQGQPPVQSTTQTAPTNVPVNQPQGQPSQPTQQAPQAPVQGQTPSFQMPPIQNTGNDELLRAFQQQKAEYEKLVAEKEQYRLEALKREEELKKIEQEKNQRYFQELDSMLDTFLKTTNPSNADELKQSVQALKGCGPETMSNFAKVLNTTVRASTTYYGAVQEINTKYEDLKRQQLTNTYANYAAPNKFGAPENRFVNPPPVTIPNQPAPVQQTQNQPQPMNISQPQPTVVVNPATGGVTTPVTFQLPMAQQQPQQPVQQPVQQFQGTPMTPNGGVSPYGMGMGMQWSRTQTTQVSANSSSAPSSFQPSKPFTLENMFGYPSANQTGNDAVRTNPFGYMDNLNQSIRGSTKTNF